MTDLDADRLIRNRSEYLAFRSFYTGFPTTAPDVPSIDTPAVALDAIRKDIESSEAPAILLSGGMDSAVLAPYMPKGSAAYTIYYEKIARTELDLAASYCRKFGLEHIPVVIDHDEYLNVIDGLIIRRSMPLSPAEPVFHIAARRAVSDGAKTIVTGSAADGWQGGFKGLRHNVPPADYVRKWYGHFLRPQNILRDAVDVAYVAEDFLVPDAASPKVDSRRFLMEVGTERFAHDNAIEAAGGRHLAPMKNAKYIYDRTRNGYENKHFIAEMYRLVYECDPPEKSGMQKPWYILGGYRPTLDDIFLPFDMKALNFDQKMQVYFLERYEILRREGLLGPAGRRSQETENSRLES